MSWSDWFTGKGSGLTDAEYAAQQKARIAAQKKETEATLAKWKQDSTARVAANTPTQEERDFQRARNTRVDLLTPDQKRLIKQGRADTPGEARDRYLAEKFPLDKYLTGIETNKGTSGTRGAVGASSAGKNNTPAPANAKNTNEETNFKQEPTADKLFDSTNIDQRFSSVRNNNTSFNINRFRSEVTGADSVLPTHSFLVVFSPFKTQIADATPSDIRNETLTLSQRVTMRCDNIILPNLGLLQEQNIRRYGYGTTENVAYGINTGDVTMQFIVDKESEILRFFEDWFDTVVNRDSKGGADMKTENRKKYAPYEVGYKDDYACPAINVFVYDRSNKAVFEYNIFDAFPINLQSINLSWSDENTMMKLNVSFAFTDFKINTPKVTTVEEKLNTLREESKSALEERLGREDKDYEASIQRRIQENLSTLPGVTIGQEVLPTTISTAPRLAPAQVSINTVNVKTPNGQIVGNA